MGLWDKIKAMDPDDVLAYQTIKLVKIRDRRLGGLHHILQLGIFLYIVVYTIVIQQRYLKLEVPSGSFRVTAQQPNITTSWFPATSYPYCLQNQSTYAGQKNYNCVYLLGLDLTYPPAMMDSILVTTRIKDTFYPLNNNSAYNCTLGSLATDLNCAPGAVTAPVSTRYYTAGIEDYTVYIEHAVFGRQSKLTVSTKDTKGTLYFRDGSGSSTTAGNLADPDRPADIFKISTILEAANIKTLDAVSGVFGGNNYRYDGVLLVMVVEYSNRKSSSKELKYEYTLYQIPDVSVVAQQPSQVTDGGYTQRTWYGVRLIITLTGTIGKFDFPTLLTALVNGLVLVKVAATVVDLLLLYVMPDKNLYSKHKFEVTEDFSDVRDREKSQKNLDVQSANGVGDSDHS